MRLSALTSRPESAPHRLQKAGLSSRIRSPIHKTIRAVASDSSLSTNLNKVVLTISWKVHFGQSLSVSGEGEELGQWNPDKSLPLAWNKGDLWAAEIPLPSGQKVEYKYVVKDSTGVLKEWQPGSNCAVAVPTGSDDSLQIADDWHGKSRSVIFKNGDVGSAPAGTFDGPPAQASSATMPVSNTDSSSISSNHNHNNAEANGAVSVSAPQLVTSSGVEANGSQQVEGRLVENTEHATEDTSMGEPNGAALEALTVKDLKDRLKGRGLMVSGRKTELVDRLAAAKTK
ncbi:MAG: hypothetical protein FRX49_10572 [Trebouxia sp. A1-2]|nr:MAG: hypothetical protein FRX49_10572 [Trebouxia sp. A1-2]